jgi:ATP-dependent DNA ligase
MSRVSVELPVFVTPQVPVLTSFPPSGGGWIHEIKHDGYRTLIRIDRGTARAFTRAGNDWTSKYARIVAACSALPCRSAILDGEVIVQNNKTGISDYWALRSAIDRQPHRLVFFAFDLLFCNGADLRDSPLIERREWLRSLVPNDPRSPLQFSDHFHGDSGAFFRKACDLGLEGIVSKLSSSRYRSGPSKTWRKAKNMSEGDFTLLGTDVDRDGKPFAHLARWEGRTMCYAGTALLTLKAEARRQFEKRTAKLITKRPIMPASSSREAIWLRPELQVRVRHLHGSKPLRHATVRELLV